MARLSICHCVPVIGVRYTSLAGVLTYLITYINRLYLQLAGFVLHLKTVFNVVFPFIRQFIDFVRHFKPTGGANTAMSAMLRQKPVSVLVLGHSYVCRLRDHLDATGQVNFNLKPVGHSVHFRGISGLQFPRLMRELPSLGEAGHDMVLLDFGTNDLSAGCSPDILVDMVMSVAETLVATYGVKQVIITEIFPRRAWKYPCPPTFNQDALRYNLVLKQKLAMHEHIHIYHHQ